MKSSIVFIMAASTFLISTSYAEQEKTTNNNPDVKPTMHKIFTHMRDLLPFMIHEDKFLDPKNNATISKKLKEMAKIAKETEHTSLIKSPTYKASSEALKTHFEEIERVYRLGNKNFARWQLNSTVPLCMSCHTQMPSHSRHWDLTEITSGALSDYERAEMFFIGRDFDSALKYYDKTITEFPDNKVPVQSLEKAFERKLVIFSRVSRDFDAGIKSLDKNLKNKKLPEFLSKNVKAWIALFRIQKREGFPNPKKRNDKAIKKYAEKILDRDLWDDMVDATNPRLVKTLTLSGVLYEYLSTFPETPLKPDILNWLAQCDRNLQETLFYSLADLYLKECMQQFPEHPTAKKCYEDYKDHLIFSYSGSSGVNLPDDVKKELQMWSDKVMKKESKK